MTAKTFNQPALPPKRRRGRKWVAAGVVLVVLAGGGVAYWLLTASDSEAGSVANATTTAEVVLTDMKKVEALDGTLGFETGDPVASSLSGTLTKVAEAGTVVSEGEVLYEIDGQPVILLRGDLPAWQTMGLDPVPISLRSSGIVTWLPDEGTTLLSGSVIARVDEQPIVILEGSIPAYRTLRNGSEGPDVQQLETALAALGYTDHDMTIDEDFTYNTYLNVRDWQEAIGAEEDGVVELGEVVFQQGAVAISSVEAAVGDSVQTGQVIAQARGTASGSEGADVAQLEAALLRLGFDPGPVDGVFDQATESAVIAWQKAVGAEADGAVDLGEVVFRPDAIRVAENTLAAGDPVGNGAAVLGASSDRVLVTVGLPASEQELLSVGSTVTVVLPDDTEAAGTVTSVASVATRDASTGEVSFEVKVTLEDVSVAEGLDEAPVEVDVTTDSRTGVVAVPVTALLALAEGGYGVEVSDGGGATHLVSVEPGLYAEGLVEVTSDWLQPGELVVTP